MTAPAAPSAVKLPPAVARQAAEAAAAVAALNNPAAAPAAPAPADPPADHQPPPAATAPPQPLSDAERLRQAEARYASLQGKYNAETAALRAQNEENNMLLRDLMTRQPVAAPAAVPPPQALSPEDYLKSIGATDADIKDYGELLPIVVRLAKNMYQPTIAKLESELNQLRSAAQQTATSGVEERKQMIWDALDRELPTWRQINESEHFLDWLRIVDIFSGVTRHVALASAFKNLDRARVVSIFKAYAGEYPDVARAPGAPVVDPATLVAPDTRGGQPPAAPEGTKKIWTETEVRDFYRRVRKKLVSNEEYQRFQKEIAAAAAEGRIRPDRPAFEANAR